VRRPLPKRRGTVIIVQHGRRTVPVMGSVGHAFLQVLGFALFSLAFLGAIQRFVAYRLRQAQADGRPYVPQADPWLSPVIAASGTVLIIVLARLLS
jgi:hypothetical protein